MKQSALTKKWGKTKLLNEIEESKKDFVAEHLESAAKYMVQIAQIRDVDLEPRFGFILSDIVEYFKTHEEPLIIPKTVEKLLIERADESYIIL